MSDYYAALSDAIQSHNIIRLEDAIAMAEEDDLDGLLSVRLDLAYSFLEQLYRLQRLRHSVLDLNQTTIAEMKSYTKPPEVVHEVMKATFIVLGDDCDFLEVTSIMIRSFCQVQSKYHYCSVLQHPALITWCFSLISDFFPDRHGQQ